jgi:hypothetical protein
MKLAMAFFLGLFAGGLPCVYLVLGQMEELERMEGAVNESMTVLKKVNGEMSGVIAKIRAVDKATEIDLRSAIYPIGNIKNMIQPEIGVPPPPNSTWELTPEGRVKFNGPGAIKYCPGDMSPIDCENKSTEKLRVIQHNYGLWIDAD